jgi:hypothetical protein
MNCRKRQTIRAATRQAVESFLETETQRRRGKCIIAIALYATFIHRSGRYVPYRTFLRILRQNGYHLVYAVGGDIYENLSLTEGA